MGPQLHLTQENKPVAGQHNYTDGKQSKQAAGEIQIKNMVSVRGFCISGSSLFHLLRCVYQVDSHCIYLEETQESWNTCSEMAAGSLCIYSVATSFMMPEKS